MPRQSKKPAQTSWPELAFESWLLTGEASLVIALRSMRLMMGGPIAAREAQRMVSEKLAATMTLGTALMAGGLAQTPEALGAATLAHYARPVRANRRRLSGSRGAR